MNHNIHCNSGQIIQNRLRLFFYLNRKKAVRAGVVAKWPGNDLPNFKRDPAQLKVLGQLVEE